jgi:hypothetical protein
MTLQSATGVLLFGCGVKGAMLDFAEFIVQRFENRG